MKKRYRIIIPILLCIIHLLQANESFADPGSEPVKVVVQTLAESTYYNTMLYGARIEPIRKISIYAPLSGTIEKIWVKEGDYVTKGSPLLSVQKISSGLEYQPNIIKSSLDGRVAKILINRGAQVFERTELAVIVDISRYKAHITVSDRDISFIKPGDICKSRDNDSVEGQVNQVALIPDYNTGLFPVTLTFSAKSPGLFIGKFLVIELYKDYYKGIALPKQDIITRYGKHYISVIEDNKVVRRRLTLGDTYGNHCAVIEGLKPGDLLITEWNKMFNVGDEVMIVESREDFYSRHKEDETEKKTDGEKESDR